MKRTLTILFAVSIAIANITAAKLAWFNIPYMGGVAVPAGFVGIGVAFLCSDLLVEFYGKAEAHKTVNSTIFALIVAYGLVWVAIILPVAPFYTFQSEYATILGSSAGITAASVITLAVSQHIDVSLFARIKQSYGPKWVRNLGSTTISQLVDTVLFITLGFAVFPFLQGGEPMWGVALISTIVGQYIVKVGLAIMDTPIFYLISGWKQ